MEKSFYVMTTTEGCATNLLENSAHRKKYEALGFKVVEDPNLAYVILINTCAYNGEMESRSIGAISEIQKKFEGKEILLSGCLPKINPKITKEVFRGKIVESPKPEQQATTAYHEFDRADFRELSFKHRLILKLRPFYFSAENLFGTKFRPLHNIFRSVVVNENFYLLTVSTGCVGQCTFCAIKHSKGKLKSRPLQVLMSEFEMGLKLGHRDFWLLGDDIGCYGQDLSSSVADLLRSMLQKKEDVRIVLNYLDPHWMLKYESELKELLADPRVICINVPLQSASESVLEKMKRDYKPQRVFKMLAEVKARNPGIAVKTNMLVGFPGESWRDYLKSLIAIFEFDAIVAMKYSPRPHTLAIKYSHQISDRTKNFRLLVMNLTIIFRHVMVAGRALFRPGWPRDTKPAAAAAGSGSDTKPAAAAAGSDSDTKPAAAAAGSDSDTKPAAAAAAVQ